MLWANKGCIYDTSQGASPLLCSWQTFGSCEVLIASKPKRTVTPLCIYVHPTFAQLELPVRIWHRKSNKYYRNNKTFSEKVSKKVVRGDTIGKKKKKSYLASNFRFWRMLPPTFLIFHAIYFWYTKHKHLIINSYHFLYSFWHADCDMNSGFDNGSTKKESK